MCGPHFFLGIYLQEAQSLANLQQAAFAEQLRARQDRPAEPDIVDAEWSEVGDNPALPAPEPDDEPR